METHKRQETFVRPLKKGPIFHTDSINLLFLLIERNCIRVCFFYLLSLLLSRRFLYWRKNLDKFDFFRTLDLTWILPTSLSIKDAEISSSVDRKKNQEKNIIDKEGDEDTSENEVHFFSSVCCCCCCCNGDWEIITNVALCEYMLMNLRVDRKNRIDHWMKPKIISSQKLIIKFDIN